MLYRFFHNLWSKSAEEIAEEELKKIGSEFYISRTGVELFDERNVNPLPSGVSADLPPIFTEVYAKNRKSIAEYDELDQQSIQLRSISNSMQDYREKAAEKIHYANCTMLASFMCDTLIKNNVNARIFGIGASHHFVIAKTEESYNYLIIDPWVGRQFKITLNEDVQHLENLSVESRLAICKAHFQETNVCPEAEYTGPLEEINQDDDLTPDMKDMMLKQAYSILPTECYFEFENQNQNENKPGAANDAVFENRSQSKKK